MTGIRIKDVFRIAGTDEEEPGLHDRSFLRLRRIRRDRATRSRSFRYSACPTTPWCATCCGPTSVIVPGRRGHSALNATARSRNTQGSLPGSLKGRPRMDRHRTRHPALYILHRRKHVAPRRRYRRRPRSRELVLKVPPIADTAHASLP